MTNTLYINNTAGITRYLCIAVLALVVQTKNDSSQKES